MSIVRLDPDVSIAELKASLYAGEIVVRTNVPAVRDFVEHARTEIRALFDPFDPEHIHEHLDPEQLALALAAFKPRFIRLPLSIELTRRIIVESGFDADDSYFDLPKLRTAFPVGHLTTGIAYAFPWHRDSWYGAPTQQINCWFPIWSPKASNAMGFDPAGFGVRVENDSALFDYYRRNDQRSDLAGMVKEDPRPQPSALGWECPTPTIVLPAPGELMLFAGDQLHRTIPNTSGLSRFSVDFRFLACSDVEAGVGAPGIDVACTGTSLRDSHRVTDSSDIPQRVVDLIEPDGPPAGATLTFNPTPST